VPDSAITRNLSGWWKGEAEDIEVPHHFGAYPRHLTYKVKIHFDQFGRTLTGEAFAEADIDFPITVHGRFWDNEFFQVQWQYSESGVEDFGVAVMKVQGIGNQIEGTLLFKRLRSDGLALARIALKKASSRDKD